MISAPLMLPGVWCLVTVLPLGLPLGAVWTGYAIVLAAPLASLSLDLTQDLFPRPGTGHIVTVVLAVLVSAVSVLGLARTDVYLLAPVIWICAIVLVARAFAVRRRADAAVADSAVTA